MTLLLRSSFEVSAFFRKRNLCLYMLVNLWLSHAATPFLVLSIVRFECRTIHFSRSEHSASSTPTPKTAENCSTTYCLRGFSILICICTRIYKWLTEGVDPRTGCSSCNPPCSQGSTRRRNRKPGALGSCRRSRTCTRWISHASRGECTESRGLRWRQERRPCSCLLWTNIFFITTM